MSRLGIDDDHSERIIHDPATCAGTVDEPEAAQYPKDRYARTVTSLAIAILCISVLASCITLPPSASLNPPSNQLAPMKLTAWLKQVAITDSELDDQKQKLQVEITLTNNLLRFLRDGNYFHNAELLPGKPQLDDLILQFEFDRYRQKRYVKAFHSLDTSDLSATLTISRPDGQLVNKVTASLKEEHTIAPMSDQAVFPSGMNARTQVIEELLRKALMAPNLSP